MSLTADPKDQRLGHGVDVAPTPQHEVYLLLSATERAKGFVRPVRISYRHVGPVGPQHPLRDLTDEEATRYAGEGYVKYEPYPPNLSFSSVVGRYWTQADLDAVGKGCGAVTTMGRDLAETYAREPRFYGATYCCACGKHLPVKDFAWDVDGSRVGS